MGELEMLLEKLKRIEKLDDQLSLFETEIKYEIAKFKQEMTAFIDTTIKSRLDDSVSIEEIARDVIQKNIDDDKEVERVYLSRCNHCGHSY